MNGGFFAYGIPSISRQSQLLWNWSPLGHSRSQVLMEWGSSVWFGSSQLVCLGRWWSTPLFYGSSTTNGFIPFFMVVKYMWLKMVASFGVCWILGWANWSWLGMTFESIMVLFGVCVEMGMGDEFFSIDRCSVGLIDDRIMKLPDWGLRHDPWTENHVLSKGWHCRFWTLLTSVVVI